MSAALVEVEGLHRNFDVDPLRRLLLRNPRRPVHVLRGVDLAVRPGEWYGIMGANGAGKTTLLKVVAGLLLPNAGAVRVDGHDVDRDARAVRARVGYALADERSFHWRLTGIENLEFFAALERLGRGETRERIVALVDRLDLGEFADRPFFEYSTGTRQRLAVARALLKRPRVLLLDEPTRSVDTAHAAELWPLVREELDAVDGCALLVTHSERDALAQCARVASLEDGRLREWSHGERERSAGPRRVALTVRDLDPEVLGRLRALDGVRSIDVEPASDGHERVTMGTENGLPTLPRLLDVLLGAGVHVRALEELDAAEMAGARPVEAPR